MNKFFINKEKWFEKIGIKLEEEKIECEYCNGSGELTKMNDPSEYVECSSCDGYPSYTENFYYDIQTNKEINSDEINENIYFNYRKKITQDFELLKKNYPKFYEKNKKAIKNEFHSKISY